VKCGPRGTEVGSDALMGMCFALVELARYRYAIDIEDPLVLQLFEHWESATALEAHFATPHFLAFSEVLLRAADGAAVFTRFEVSTEAPLFG